MEAQGETMEDMENRNIKCLQCTVSNTFQDSSLSMKTKRLVYHAVVLGVLLYRAEMWVTKTKRAAIRKLESFNNRCLRCVLGITNAQQCIGHITSVEIRRRFGVQEILKDVGVAKRLCWLGHVSHMDDTKRLLFGWLPQKRPAHGTTM